MGLFDSLFIIYEYTHTYSISIINMNIFEIECTKTSPIALFATLSLSPFLYRGFLFIYRDLQMLQKFGKFNDQPTYKHTSYIIIIILSWINIRSNACIYVCVFAYVVCCRMCTMCVSHTHAHAYKNIPLYTHIDIYNFKQFELLTLPIGVYYYHRHHQYYIMCDASFQMIIIVWCIHNINAIKSIWWLMLASYMTRATRKIKYNSPMRMIYQKPSKSHGKQAFFSLYINIYVRI